ncbi:ATP-dependent helicase HrpB [Myxococcus sp. K15C18031901]|uniref:ATP-dependent helicase HrpB n=1 Tax=Myxococcus dinghuensis TaxID=2906761 RepID=UPI0020A7472F|nr:ATP-dependent helicase HrpB [Myxococcus dinghuensis]MCP3103308.1 ATP-dependent helicase HrpB [Myxococcus dinghuensis]
MGMDKLGAVGGAGMAPSVESGRERFGKVMEEARPRAAPVATEATPARAVTEAPAGVSRAESVGGVASSGCVEARQGPRVDSVQSAREQQAARMLDRVGQAQKRLDGILELAESGRSFSPAELLAFQAQVYRASQELDLAGKVVEKATGGVKQVLQTQV